MSVFDNIFDSYSASELREIFREDTNSWPEEFCSHLNNMLANELLDEWLENHDDSKYREKIRDIVEDLTYGYEDDDGNELKEFEEGIENDGQMRLF